MRARIFLFAAMALLFAACIKNGLDGSDFAFDLTVRNEQYAAELVLTGVGEATIVSVGDLPDWVAGVTLRDEGFQGDPVLLVGVNAQRNLKEKREAEIALTMSSGAKVKLSVTQWPNVGNGMFSAYKSMNEEFEKDWASGRTIKLVISNVDINGRPEIVTEEVALPWAYDLVPASYLPKGDGHDESMETYKMVSNKGDWSLVFNLTGINNLPDYNYFGLYNRYTGVLRIFYYFTKDLVPENTTNDHLWSFSLNADLAEHAASQFALPRQERATADYLTMASRPFLTTPTTDSFNPLTDSGRTVPAVGWWAFDVDLSVYREHDFFQKNLLNAMTLQLCTFNQQNVMLNSILQGSITGNMTGKMNLDLIAPVRTQTWAKIVSPIMSGIGNCATNAYLLQSIGSPAPIGGGDVPVVPEVNQEVPAAQAHSTASYGRPKLTSATVAIVSLVVGTLFQVAGKMIDNLATEQVHDEKFGQLNATINLDLNAAMNTVGTVGGATTNKVPPASIAMEYIKKTNPDGTPTNLGKGIWNLEYHPVVYVVKDAYWSENHFHVISNQKEYPYGDTDVYSYYLGDTKATRPGLRLITFFDPTSVRGVAFNNDLFDEEFDQLRVYLSYGVYPGSKPGYTDAFRKAAGLDYPHCWRLSEQDKFDSAKELKLIKKVHTDDLFKTTEIIDFIKDEAGYRLSNQKLRNDHVGLERRYYGASLFYENPYASEFDVDKVQYVYDPQVYVPFDESSRRLYDPQVPDFVVTSSIYAYGKDTKDEGSATLTNTLRFLPEIRLVSYTELPAIYAEIQERLQHMGGNEKATVVWMDIENMVDHIGEIVDAVNGKK